MPNVVRITTVPSARRLATGELINRHAYHPIATNVARCASSPGTPSSTAYLRNWLSAVSGISPARVAVTSAVPSPYPQGRVANATTPLVQSVRWVALLPVPQVSVCHTHDRPP